MKQAFLLILVLYAYSSLAQRSYSNSDAKELIINCYNNLSKYNTSINDKVLKTRWNSDQKVEELFSANQFSIIQNFDITSEKDVIKFEKAFSKKEISSMRKQIRKFKTEKWSDMIGTKFLDLQITKRFNKYFSFSAPAFNNDKTMAIIYVESPSSGDLRVYKKNAKGKWKYFANGLVWRAD